ncbi:MAG: hypothetical protein J5748_02945 [Bacteroidales bacterium]|nr:hypothetical protein [Bacteroidales bacterium]
MKAFGKILLFACALAVLGSCVKDDAAENARLREAYTKQYVNQFAYGALSVYYLWIDEIRENLAGWMSDDDPKAKVLEVRYKDASGKDIDRWTQVTDDYETFIKSVENVSKTYGYEFRLFYTTSEKSYLGAAVEFVYADSPAEKAGLKRGDFITEINGSPIPAESYKEIVKKQLLGSASCTLGLHDGRTVTMEAVEMYCDPVHITKVFDCGGKKVGYLHFTAFTLNARADLIKACTALKAKGISELILDLRYNGGGYVETEELLASMLAPSAIVDAGDVFMTEIYNSLLTAAWGEDEGVSHFRNKFQIGSATTSTAEANLGISKLYVIMTGDSASASEALVCGLKPLMDVEIVGEQSYGKYCSGLIIEGADWYNNYKKSLSTSDYKNGVKYAANWGIYVMIGRYADRDGNTPCMPDGFAPDHFVADNPFDGHQLGDPDESMLKAALTLAGYPYPVESASAVAKKKPALEGPASPKRESFGVFLRRQII